MKPVTHYWGSGSCAGASWIFREGRKDPRIAGGTGAAGPHWGHCPTPSAFGSCLDLPVPVHGKPPGATCRETEPLPETPQGRSSMEFLPLALPWLPLGLWMAGVGSGVSPAPCPCFWGHSGPSVTLRSDSHPHTGFLTFLCGWNGVVGLALLVESCWSLECN